jgi:hypothetical protein
MYLFFKKSNYSQNPPPPQPPPFHTPSNPHNYALVYRSQVILPSGKNRDLKGIGRGGGLEYGNPSPPFQHPSQSPLINPPDRPQAIPPPESLAISRASGGVGVEYGKYNDIGDNNEQGKGCICGEIKE